MSAVPGAKIPQGCGSVPRTEETQMKALAVLAFAATVAVGGIVPRHAVAQAFPSKPLRLVVPYATGGATDIIARAAAAEMSKYARPDGRGGESAWRRREPRRRNRRAVRAGRLHHADVGKQPAWHQPVPVLQPHLRSEQGSRAGDRAGVGRERAGGQSRREGERRCRNWSPWRRRSRASSPVPPAAADRPSTCRARCSSRRWA